MIRAFLKPLSFLPALLLMYMIFSFSAQPGEVSSQMSYQISHKIIEAADYVFDANLNELQINEWANKIHFITRKLAHMTEYFLLAVAVSFPLYVYGLHGILLMLAAGLICVGFACGDEYHQSFVMGRGPSAKDVCIDSIGIFFGIIFVRIVGWTGRKTIFKPKAKKKKQRKKCTKKADPCYDDRYGSYPPRDRSGYREAPYNEPYSDRYDSYPPRDCGGYREAPYNEPFYGYEQKQRRQISDGQEDISRKDDWGMEEYRPPKRQTPESSARKKRKKKEKDWFFDM